jgi:hypothetical protein
MAAVVEDTPLPRSSSSSPSNKNKLIIVAIVLGVAVIALAVGLGVGLGRNDNNGSSSSSSNNAAAAVNSSPSSNAAAVNSSPSTPTVSSSSSSATGPAPTPPVVVLDKIRISDATTRSLPLVSSEALGKTYKDCDDLKVDWRKAAFLMANKTITQNLESYYFTSGDDLVGGGYLYTEGGDDGAVSTAGPPRMEDSAVAAPTAGSAGGAKNSPSVTTTESSFGTNNQEDGVEEADVVLSDGTHIYTAYGGEVSKACIRFWIVKHRLTPFFTFLPKTSHNRLSKSVWQLNRWLPARPFPKRAVTSAAHPRYPACSWSAIVSSCFHPVGAMILKSVVIVIVITNTAVTCHLSLVLFTVRKKPNSLCTAPPIWVLSARHRRCRAVTRALGRLVITFTWSLPGI